MTLQTRDGADTAVFDYSDETSTFCDRLVLSREAAGLGQGELATRMGVKAQTVRAWEEDHAEPRANRLQMLAGMLNVSMVWLMSGQGAGPDVARPSAKSPAAADCLADLRDLRTEQTQLAEKMARLEQRLRAVLA
jgi:transcriptional regulator with XRE-family HTH domain